MRARVSICVFVRIVLYLLLKRVVCDRYYLLTTADMSKADRTPIEEEIKSIARKHGCQVIVNHVYTSLKYYLRLLSDPSDFIERYVNLMKNDENVKYHQQAAWNEIISKLNL